MKILLTSILLFSGLLSCKSPTGSKQVSKSVATDERKLTMQPSLQQNWQNLYKLLNDNYTELHSAEWMRLRDSLEKYGAWSTGTLYTEGEPGTKIIINGTLVNTQVVPIANAALHIFQTDSHGYYTPLDSVTHRMGEPEARLFSFIKSDSSGHFQIRTIRPASYPKAYEGRIIPQHIHINIIAEGYTSQQLQMVFDNDPAMNEYWQEWAKRNGFPILHLEKEEPDSFGSLKIVMQGIR
jgi:protocatechuate 3,4-dioxygenase beta subunit